jgi:hypothetical protein
MAAGAEGEDDKSTEAQQGSTPAPPANETSDAHKVGEGASASAAESSAESADAEPAWPPREAAPREVAPDERSAVLTSAPKQPVVMAPTEADAQGGAALPGQEMGFSDSTLHWLEGGETTGTTRTTSPTGSLPSYDPRAPVAGRRRAVVVVGGAGALALIVAGTLFVQARGHRPAEAPRAARVEPARDLTVRAEAALAANRITEATDLAHLAVTADPRYADAHFVMAKVQRAHNQIPAAKQEYRKYLELAPLGLHAAEARLALDSLGQ